MMKYTWKDIFKRSKEHPLGGGAKMTHIYFPEFCFSVVGGREGLYGNFFDTFEVAVIREKDREFITNEVLSDFMGGKYVRLNDEVLAYLELDEVVNILNYLNEKYATE